MNYDLDRISLVLPDTLSPPLSENILTACEEALGIRPRLIRGFAETSCLNDSCPLDDPSTCQTSSSCCWPGPDCWRSLVWQTFSSNRARAARCRLGRLTMSAPLLQCDRPMGVLVTNRPLPAHAESRNDPLFRGMLDTLERCAHLASRTLERHRDASPSLREEVDPAFDQTPVGLAHLGLDGALLRANRKFMELAGFEGRELSRVMPRLETRENGPLLSAARKDRLHRGEDSIRCRTSLRRVDGAWQRCLISISLARDHSRNPLHFIIVAEADSSEPKDLLSAPLARHAPLPILLLDEQARVIAANPAGRPLLDRAWRIGTRSPFGSAGEFPCGPKTLSELRATIGSVLRDRCCREHIVRLAPQERFGQPENLQQSKEMDAADELEPLLMRAVIFPARDPGEGTFDEGQVLALLHPDAVEQMASLERRLKRAEEQAAESRKAKDSFLAAVSHEIRSPLNGILGMTRLSLMADPNPGVVNKYLKMAEKSGENLLAIVGDILEMSRLQEGAVTLNAEDFEFRSVVVPVTKAFERLARDKGLLFSTDIDPAIPDRLHGDAGKLLQVLTNLVDNAIKFTREGGVHVQAKLSSGNHVRDADAQDKTEPVRVVFQIQDTGIGIAADCLDKIFESFQQARGGYTRDFGGTGLGLAISRELVHMMDGTIQVRSKPGQGSAFTYSVLLSRSRKADAHPQELVCAEPETKSTQRLSVLVAEDNEINACYVMQLLREMGHDPVLARDGQEALASLERHAFDLALMDIAMPRMDGMEFTRRVRRGTVKSPGPSTDLYIVAITAYASNKDRQRMLDCGMDDFLPKPLDPGRLRRVLHEAVLRRSGRRCDVPGPVR